MAAKERGACACVCVGVGLGLGCGRKELGRDACARRGLLDSSLPSFGLRCHIYYLVIMMGFVHGGVEGRVVQQPVQPVEAGVLDQLNDLLMGVHGTWYMVRSLTCVYGRRQHRTDK